MRATRHLMRLTRHALCAALCLSALSCGGGGGTIASSSSSSSSGGGTTPPASNVVSVVVDGGPTASSPDVNTLFTTVTVCAPGSTTNCQTIDHIQVDTGSYGLRILASVLSVSLPLQTTANGDNLLECTQFVDGYSWGPVALADVQISGESAGSVPVQVIGTSTFTTVPSDCSSATNNPEDTVATFGANGVLGIGPFVQDCGAACATTAEPGAYYACTASECQSTAVALTAQVPNPITFFSTDKNGVIIQLPSVAAAGAATVTGSMIFGIDTESNNKSGSQSVLTLVGSSAAGNQQPGSFTTTFNGQTLTESILDTGSNGLYFNDSSIAQCTSTDYTGFYCPASTEGLSATLQGENGVMADVSFSISNAETLGNDNPTYVAFATLGGTFSSSTDTFDWGLPFYYGRTVYSAIENATTSVGTGPYVAF